MVDTQVIAEVPFIDNGINENQTTSDMNHSDNMEMDVDIDVHGEDEPERQIAHDNQQEFIEIEYHPHSGKHPIRVPIEKYDTMNSETVLQNNIDEIWGESKPWHPFRTAKDLEFAEMCTRLNFSKNTSQEWLDFLKGLNPPNSDVTFSSSSEMNKLIESAAMSSTGFESVKFTVPYKSKNYEYEVLRRPVWDWSDDIIFLEIRKFASGMSHGLETSSGNCSLPKETFPVCLLLWSDKGRVSDFGGRKSYSVIARILNLPSGVHNSNGFAGGHIVGWLPIVGDDAENTGKHSWANHHRVVWHDAMFHVLESLVEPATTGEWFECGDEIIRQLLPSIFIYSLDYEEQSIATLNCGVNGEAACPTCEEQTTNFLSSLSGGKPRTTSAYACLWNMSSELTVEEREKVYKPLGLVFIKNCFWKFPHTDIYSTMSYDVLHANELGVCKRLWKYTKEYFSGDRAACSRIENRIAHLPPWRDLSTFSDVFSIDFADGSKYADLIRIILHGIAPEISQQNQLIIQCFRCLGVISNYSWFKMHTEDTIAEGREEIKQLSKFLKNTSEKYGWTWNILKIHALLAHLFDDIEAKGVTSTYNTKLNEQAHGPLKKAAKNFNDKQENLGRQLMKHEHQRFILSIMKENANDLMQKNEAVPSKIQHVSMYGRGCEFDPNFLPLSLATNPMFSKFSIHLNACLTLIYWENGKIQAHETIKLRHSGKIRQFYEVNIDYVSEEDWSVSRSILHCKDLYRDHPRHDCVMLIIDSHISYGRLMFLFEVTVDFDGCKHSMALVQLFEPISKPNWKDRAIGFHQLKEITGDKNIIIVSLESVI
ncbi:hypothetical protein BDQ17DRAFT_1428433 [Cyathus striatus]|nr:hypothetical protein BDQ17DRAFT_1428433 [Cyathus striatus]